MHSSSRRISLKMAQLIVAASLLLHSLVVAPASVRADNSGLHFQRPGSGREQNKQVNKKFRRPGLSAEIDEQPEVSQVAAAKVVTVAKSATKKPATPNRVVAEQTAPARALRPVRKSPPARQQKLVRRDRQVAVASGGTVQYDSELTSDLRLASHGCDICDGPCTCEASCGMYEPGCGIAEPSCGCGEPSCGICEPGCGIEEPSCGCGDVGCGSCVGSPGPDYWCFPVCLPRLKDLSVFAGVQGYRGPLDFANGESNSNFGFNEGFNLSGSAPLVNLLFPQLSYQFGYRATQSRLYGTATDTADRTQQFLTVGLFRRVETGVQCGLVWDWLKDDLSTDRDLEQLRGELSLKSPLGREVGFWFAAGMNDAVAFGALYETVDQYALFYRWAYGNGYECRLWGGATGDKEGLFGGDFNAPLNNRWSLQTGFNFLIPDKDAGLVGVSEESWNIGINLVWHLGKTARRGCRSPYRPLFAVADNGWMFVDEAQ